MRTGPSSHPERAQGNGSGDQRGSRHAVREGILTDSSVRDRKAKPLRGQPAPGTIGVIQEFGGGHDIRGGGGFGPGGRRMFGSGGVKLAVLKLLSEEPAHGYHLIKKMEERLAGGYSPSAGAIYPTLNLLEDEGLIEATKQENRKMYSITAEGSLFLEQNKARVQAVFAQMEEAGRVFARGRSPELIRAIENLRGAVSARVARGNAPPEQIRKMAEAIHAAARTIDEL